MGEIENKYTLLESFCIFLLAGPTLLLVVALSFPLTLVTAWIRWKLWAWFAVPFLHLPMVPYWAMVGLGILIGTFHGVDRLNGYKPTFKEQVSQILGSGAIQFITLGIGYLIHTHI